ncbi:unnamed protein product [Mytilus edulis]|uniref:Uncharacterized protein n=1 Tax=Mytilus edulis TaxID=6550 RepID=A0A8S3U6N8_MYTED|nr:unnamed protein product [Mytilus edulis]
MWKEKPDSWQELHADKPFYNPRKRPNKQLNDTTDEELLRCLLNCCDWKNLTLPSKFQREITAWKSDKPKLLELCVKRWEIEDMRTAKDLLFTYKENPDLKQNMKDYNVNLSFNPNSTQEESPKGYSDVVRDLATTFCRISNSLPILVKKDGMWKTPPHDWN